MTGGIEETSKRERNKGIGGGKHTPREGEHAAKQQDRKYWHANQRNIRTYDEAPEPQRGNCHVSCYSSASYFYYTLESVYSYNDTLLLLLSTTTTTTTTATLVCTLGFSSSSESVSPTGTRGLKTDFCRFTEPVLVCAQRVRSEGRDAKGNIPNLITCVLMV